MAPSRDAGAAPGLRVLTLNLGLLHLRLFGRTLYAPAPFVEERLPAAARFLRERDADVVAVQEAWARRHRRFLVEALADTYPHIVDADVRRRAGYGGGLMLFARHPVRASRFVPFRESSWFERLLVSKGCLLARLDVPGVGEVAVANAHTTAGGLRHPEHPTTERTRRLQLEETLDALEDEVSCDLRVLVGDLNAGPEASPTDYAVPLARGYVDAAAKSCGPGGPGPTWDNRNALVAGGRHDASPDMRIDHVFVGGPRTEHVDVRHAEVVARESAIVTRDGTPVPLSDHYGLEVLLSLGRARAA